MGDQGPLTLMSSVSSPVHPPAPFQDRCVGTRAPGGMGLDLVSAASAPGDQPQLGLPRHRRAGLTKGRGQSMVSTRREWLHRVESGSLVIGHIDNAARRWFPTSLLRNVGSSYSEEPWLEIL